MRFRISYLISALLLSLSFCHAQKTYSLEYKLEKGDIFTQELTNSTTSNMEIAGQKMVMVMNMIMTVQNEVLEKKENSYIIQMKFNELTMEMEVAGAKTVFSSDNTKNSGILGEELGAIFKLITSLTFDTEMSKTGKILSVSGFENLANKLMETMGDDIDEEKMEELLTQFERLFSNQSMFDMLAQNSSYYPEKPVKKNESWTSSFSSGGNPINLQVDVKMTLKKVKKNIATIQCEGTMSAGEGTIQEVMDMQTNINVAGTTSGYMQINLNNGLAIKSEFAQDAEGGIEILGVPVPMKIKSKTFSTTTK